MSLGSVVADEQSDLEIIKERYIENLLESTPSREEIKDYLLTLDFETGAWSDIDYASTIGSGWDTNEHPARASRLGMYYRKHEESLSVAEKSEIERALHSVWGYWFRVKPRCTTNWFPNVFACPRGLTHSFLLMQEIMTPEECELAEKIVFNKTTIQKTGANLITSADIILSRSLFKGDAELARLSIDAILSTVVISSQNEDGIQPDYSYQLHGPQQQFGNYGIASLRSGYSVYCNLLRGTSFAFSDEQIEMLTNYLCDGYKWIMWRGYMDINSSGRHYSEGRLKRQGDVIVELAAKVARACNDEQKVRIQTMIDKSRGEVEECGHKSFYCSDGVYHHSTGWASSLKMNSFRVVGGEQGDNNLKGYYVGDGAFYTYVDGDEYENVTPLWDWHKVPGITCYEKSTPVKSIGSGRLPRNQSAFVGDCTDGRSGIATMVLNRDSIYANKTWVVTDDFVLCMGNDVGDITGEAQLTTSIEQRFSRGDLLYLDGEKWRKIKGERVSSQSDTRFYNGKSGYIVLDNTEAVASVEHREGDWAEIDRANVSKVVKGDVMSLFVRHREQPGSYEYMILPNRTKEEIANFDTTKVKVLSNSNKLQLVEYGGVYYATVFERGVYEFSDVKFRALTAGIYMFRKLSSGEWSVVAHDPEQNLADDEIGGHLLVL